MSSRSRVCGNLETLSADGMVNVMSDSVVVLGYGAVGRAVTAQLAARGGSIIVGQRREPAGLPRGAIFSSVDLTVHESVVAACAGAGAVICCAGFPYRSDLWESAWPVAMRNMLDASATARARFVFADNLYMYGPQSGALVETMPLTSLGRKPKVRADITRRWQAEHDRGRVEAVAVRASDFYGPKAETSVLSAFGIARLIAGKSALIPYSPDHPHDFTYVPDFARALVTLLDAPSDCYGQAWHVPNAPTRTLRELLAMAAGMITTPLRVRMLPQWLKPIIGLFEPNIRELLEMQFQTDRPYRVDSSKFGRRFWNNPTGFGLGIAATVASYL
jgi:nucleoside-diphosphate-sugar epimerase